MKNITYVIFNKYPSTTASFGKPQNRGPGSYTSPLGEVVSEENFVFLINTSYHIIQTVNLGKPKP